MQRAPAAVIDDAQNLQEQSTPSARTPGAPARPAERQPKWRPRRLRVEEEQQQAPLPRWAAWWFKRSHTIEQKKEAEKHGAHHALLEFRKHLQEQHRSLSRLIVHQNEFDFKSGGGLLNFTSVVAFFSSFFVVGMLIRCGIFVR